MKSILLMISIFLCLPFIYALEVYSGEQITLDVDKTYSYYTFSGNSTALNLNITQEGNKIIINPDKYSSSDSFEIIFFDKDKEVITVYSGGGSGGSKTIYRDRNSTNNVTEYVDKEKIVYQDKEKEVEKQVEKEVKAIPIWVIVLIIGLVLAVLAMVAYHFSKDTTTERRLEETNE